MSIRKLLYTSSAAALGLGIVGVPVVALAEDGPPNPTSASSHDGSTARPTVTEAGGTFTVTLPGEGSLMFGVNPATDALTGLTVMPDPGVTAGTPVPREEGVEVPFTGTTGTERLEVQVESENGTPKVEAKVDGRGENDAQRDDQGDDNDADDAVTPQTTTPPSTMPGNNDNENDAAGDQADAPEMNDDQGDAGQTGEDQGDIDHSGAPATTTVPTRPALSNSSPGGPPTQSGTRTDGDSGSGDHGSGDGDSSDGPSGSDGSGSGSDGGGSGH